MSGASSLVTVVGDCMLDRYWDGRVTRISPEAPVPIVHMRAETDRLGGAANVALNVCKLGAPVRLFGAIGQDAHGQAFLDLLRSEGIEQDLVVDARVTTIVKLRVVSQHHQLLRVDFETPLPQALAAAVAERFRCAVTSAGCVVMSDYAKGALQEVRTMIRVAKEAGRSVVVDPKGDDFARYAGADVITPNQGELAQVVGAWADEDELHRKATELRRAFDIGSLLLTRSERGMSLFSEVCGESGRMDFPAEARDVYDVTGAGDTAIATLAAMLAEGRPLVEATRLANRAAGMVVGKFGTSSVTRAELLG
jgi:D-glycero-beta-D-manno-heptose-7-phosphate kinase